ncbi:ABC transporter permease [Brevibacterium album]|uniref:ABC transporter permease n=1 Tax=Brevibacterium album TaxID=417948 RepID=UPI000686B90D|nr:ABC transporter permease [Brevibacterium album]
MTTSATLVQPAVLLALALLAGAAWALTALLRLEQSWLQAWALLRAVFQLGLLSLVLRFVLGRRDLVLLFLLVMVVVAATVVARRLGWSWAGGLRAAGVIAAAAAVPGIVVFASGAVPAQPRYLLAVGGIVIGGVMTVSTLFGRALDSELRAQRPQIEAWLALGAGPRSAARGAVRAAGAAALVPSTDQTRVTGLVALPGAFVGAVFGGLPVLDAAVFQLMVLAALLAAGVLAVALWTLLLGAPRTLPEAGTAGSTGAAGDARPGNSRRRR